ncbi:MAG: hypothetical protein LUH22_14705 [Bacteroides sp.]|nr:hypothetical protein [Bacteroides sp.]
MINPLDYLYYKIYKAWSFLSGGDYPIKHQAAMLLLIWFNILTVYFLFFKELPSEKFNIACVIVIGIIILIIYRPKREAKIVAKFEKESEDSRIIGNILVICYVVGSIYLGISLLG